MIEPGYFHRLAIAAGADDRLGDWLRTTLGARSLTAGMRQVHGMPFGSDRPDADPGSPGESGAFSEIVWLGRSPFVLLIAADAEGQLGRYVARYGTGLHSVAWTVEDLWGADAKLRHRGIRITGVDIGGRHFFLHPADTSGLLMELTDTEFEADPRDKGFPSEPAGGTVDVVGIAWVTTVVSDARAAGERLAELVGATPVEGLPRPSGSSDVVVDMAVSDVVIRYVTPQDPASRFAGFAEKYQQRLHSMCLEVGDLSGALDRLRGAGIGVADETGATAWTDPAATKNLAIEWVGSGSLPAR
jgi:4-hydroxyphenylpyruvate dioxygenase-like putative hemolysin